jgi:hypothetical protein
MLVYLLEYERSAAICSTLFLQAHAKRSLASLSSLRSVDTTLPETIKSATLLVVKNYLLYSTELQIQPSAMRELQPPNPP